MLKNNFSMVRNRFKSKNLNMIMKKTKIHRNSAIHLKIQL